MEKLRLGAKEFGESSGETLELLISAPGEFKDLVDFASRTLLACRLVGPLIVQQAPRRYLSELDRAAWVAEYIHRFAGIDLPPPADCLLYAHVELENCLELAIEAGERFIGFRWDREMCA